MDNYLLALGWWNFIGSFMMLAMLYQPFGQQLLNKWTYIFKEKLIIDTSGSSGGGGGMFEHFSYIDITQDY